MVQIVASITGNSAGTKLVIWGIPHFGDGLVRGRVINNGADAAAHTEARCVRKTGTGRGYSVGDVGSNVVGVGWGRARRGCH